MSGPGDITGLVLAGGQGSRMGGVDKGLQPWRGTPLALNALRRLRPHVGAVMVSANRNIAAYEAFGAPVVADTIEGYAGPLAGFLAGLRACATPWLLAVPCDVPLFPADLAARLLDAATRAGADIAIAAAPEGEAAAPRRQPVFCLMRAALLPSLERFTSAGGRKVGQWAGEHACAIAAFDSPGAFANANTLAELHALEEGPTP